MQGVGLLALLLGVCLIFYLMFGGKGGGSTGAALNAKKQSEAEIYKATGRDAEGAIASDSIKFDTNDKGIVITAVTPGGAFEQKYGLAVGDVVLEAGALVTKEQAGGAKDTLNFAFSRTEPLVVQRGTQRLKLPDERAITPPPQLQPQAQAPADTPPPSNANPQRTTPRRQLDGILKGRDENAVPTH